MKTGATVLPCPMYGSHPYHHWGVHGTIPLRFETHIALIEDIINGTVVAGSEKFIILPAHGIELSAPGLVFSWPASFNH